jgi:hypothetical protein
MRRVRIRSASLALAGILTLTAGAVTPALATETTRAEYTTAVEPICKANTQSNERILKGVRADVKAGKLKPAAAQFAKASAALKKTLGQLRAVPQPTADRAKLTKWLGYVGQEADLFAAAGRKLKAGDKVGAQAMVVRLTHNANLANDQVLAYDFNYCRFDTSKFT